MISSKLIKFLQDVFPVNLPDEVVKMIAETLWTHVMKRQIVDDIAEYRKKNILQIAVWQIMK